MNNILKKEIISHIFKCVGIFNNENLQTNMFEKINKDKFLLDKKIAFEEENGKQKLNNLWAATAKIENSNIKIIIADITEDISEFSLILQMDTFFPCAMRLSQDKEDFGAMYVNIQDNKWINATTAIQAKMLVGFESLFEIFLQWQKPNDYMDMYKIIIDFLNYLEQEDNAW